MNAFRIWRWLREVFGRPAPERVSHRWVVEHARDEDGCS